MKYKNIEDLPLTLTVKEISEIMGLSLSKAYELCHSKGFPSVNIGTRIIVPKLALIKWMSCPNQGEQ
ncbi:MAG: helix-turn-helix domain-containing protein [Ruminiclostridium sp.]